MADSIKIGPRIPPELWQAFKEFSEAKHGKQRKEGDELATAIENHLELEQTDHSQNVRDLTIAVSRLSRQMEGICASLERIEKRQKEALDVDDDLDFNVDVDSVCGTAPVAPDQF